MEDKLIKVNHDHFLLSFKNEGSGDYNLWWSGSVIQIQMFSDGTWKYQSNESSDLTDNRSEARIWFEWSLCYRGVWEGRIYFKDEEYWGSELVTIPLIWCDVEHIVKKEIMKDNVDQIFEW